MLTITLSASPATDLGYLLAKHPDRCQRFSLPFGTAHAFYPEASEERCTFTLAVEVDPIGLVRRQGGPPTPFTYVNDRPYAASSMLSVAISKVLGSALNGRCKERTELAETRLPFEARLACLPCRRGDSDLIQQLFEPLGYEVQAEQLPLDERFPEWGDSPYYDVTLRGTVRLAELLQHLYVLVPVLDNDKHYWVGDAEVDKLLEKGKDWLPAHPHKELISRRYLKHQRSLARRAIERLTPDLPVEEEKAEEQLEQKIRLNDVRHERVVETLKAAGVRSVVDLGCGEGKLLRALLKSQTGAARDFDRLLGVEVSTRSLERCRERLHLDRMSESQRARIDVVQGALTYRDPRLKGFDGATLIEVIEHVDPERLDALERVVFGDAAPGCVLVTTPNREYNALFQALGQDKLRHRDHRFEWSRAEFEAWCTRVGEAFGYAWRSEPIGPEDTDLGAPTQMAIFTRTG